MTEQNKRDVIIAAVMGTAAIIVFWMLGRKTVIQSGGDGNAITPPGYMTTNVPVGGFDLPAIDMSRATNFSLGNSCCPGCAGDMNSANDSNIGQFFAFLGRGTQAGALP